MDPVTNPEGFAAGIGIFTVIIIIVSAVIPIGLTAAIFYFVFKKIRANNALIASGESAQAQILSASETGVTLNNQPQVAFALQVTRQGQPPYQTNTQAYVSQFHMAKLQVGATVPVKVDPGDPLKVAIDMNMLANMPMGGMQMGMQPGMQMGMQPGMQPQAYGMQPGSQPGSQPQAYGAQPGMQPGMQPGSQPQGYGMQPGSQPQMAGGQCPACQQSVPPGSPSCPYCGTRLQ